MYSNLLTVFLEDFEILDNFVLHTQKKLIDRLNSEHAFLSQKKQHIIDRSEFLVVRNSIDHGDFMVYLPIYIYIYMLC